LRSAHNNTRNIIDTENYRIKEQINNQPELMRLSDDVAGAETEFTYKRGFSCFGGADTLESIRLMSPNNGTKKGTIKAD
jgi:hypothetical protein